MHRMRHIERGAELGHKCRLLAAFYAQLMIDCCGFDLAGKRPDGEQQQCQTVRSARHRDAKAFAQILAWRAERFRPEICQIAPKQLDQLRRNLIG
jgi:hypothetical protein